MPIFLIVGIRSGIFNVTESSAVAVVYALMVGLFIHRELNWHKIWLALVSSARGTAVIMIILGTGPVKGFGVTLTIGIRRFRLTGGGGDAWARDRTMDAAIVAALRSAREMSATSLDRQGNTIRDVYLLKGAATALDAAALGCAGRR